MKGVLFAMLAILAFSPMAMAGDGGKSPEANESNGIHWLSVDELQVKMREHPRKVYMDIYTDWCGWCKVMEKKTFSNPEVIKYLNEKFYCVRFNSERKDEVHFMGKDYSYDPQYKSNTLAVQLMHGQMSYPTSVIMEELFQNPQPIPGYQDVPTIEMILKYFGENTFKTENWPEYQKSFKGTWKYDATPATPMGH